MEDAIRSLVELDLQTMTQLSIVLLLLTGLIVVWRLWPSSKHDAEITKSILDIHTNELREMNQTNQDGMHQIVAKLGTLIDELKAVRRLDEQRDVDIGNILADTSRKWNTIWTTSSLTAKGVEKNSQKLDTISSQLGELSKKVETLAEAVGKPQQITIELAEALQPEKDNGKHLEPEVKKPMTNKVEKKEETLEPDN